MKEENLKLELPTNFLYGASMSAHQVEGNNTNSDWWQAETLNYVAKSGCAADHYNLYAQDFNIAKQLNLNAIRISIEWSRIEPKEGYFNYDEIEHYKAVLLNLKEKQLKSMVTLHHFTLPAWFANKGGFAKSKNLHYFARYVKLIVEELGVNIDYWNTVNEPEVYTVMSSLKGVWPPFKQNPVRALFLYRNLASAHKIAFQIIKQKFPQAQIGLAKNNVYYEPSRENNLLDKLGVKLMNWLGNFWFLDMVRNNIDFIGINYYFYNSISIGLDGFKHKNRQHAKSDMGDRTYPKGLYYVIQDLHKRYDKPICITENGIANATDQMRSRFIKEHLFWISKALENNIEIFGYFYWSLIDTYEWNDGTNPKFGLVEINFDTLERKIRSTDLPFN